MRMRRLCMAAVFASLVACRSTPPAEEGTPAARGQSIFRQQCAVCHDAASKTKKIGPGLKGLFSGGQLTDGKPATEANIRARIDAGRAGMPPFADVLVTRERDDVIAYLKTL
jgi:mono/diheme cytochrome c family protein